MFSDPNKNVLEFGFIPGQKVVDLGSGAGHYTSALSRALGPQGRVYAVDLHKDMLVKLKNEMQMAGRENIEVIHGDIEKLNGTHLRDEIMDGAVFSNILFQLDDVAGALAEVKRVLRTGGRVAVVEWSDTDLISKALAKKQRHPINEEMAKRLFEKAGFKFERAFKAGEHHYGVIFKKPIQ